MTAIPGEDSLKSVKEPVAYALAYVMRSLLNPLKSRLMRLTILSLRVSTAIWVTSRDGEELEEADRDVPVRQLEPEAEPGVLHRRVLPGKDHRDSRQRQERHPPGELGLDPVRDGPAKGLRPRLEEEVDEVTAEVIVHHPLPPVGE